MHMILIDDAGSGSFVGGTCIGIYDEDSNLYKSFIIPIEYFSSVNFNKKSYLEYAVKKTLSVLEDFKTDGKITLCRGYMFDSAEKTLKASGFEVFRTNIEGILQRKIEMSFRDHVFELGLFPEYIKYTKYPFHFHKLLRWVLACPDERVSLCKTGWKAWKKHKDVKLKKRTMNIEYNNLYCMKCGCKLYPGEEAKVIEYSTNKINYIYMHTFCPKKKRVKEYHQES